MYEAQYNWKKAHPDKVKEIGRKYREKRREYFRKYNKEWKEKNRERLKKEYKEKSLTNEWRIKRHEAYIKYREKYGKQSSDGTSYTIRFQVLQRDNFTCQYCGRKAPEVILHVDHKIPKSKGGKSNQDNLITACFECNMGKLDKLL